MDHFLFWLFWVWYGMVMRLLVLPGQYLYHHVFHVHGIHVKLIVPPTADHSVTDYGRVNEAACLG